MTATPSGYYLPRRHTEPRACAPRPTSSVLWLTCVYLVLSAGCASTTAPTPKERYIEAVNYKMAGDAERYTDALLALAHDAKDTRAGRRARATVSGGGLTSLASLATVATVVSSMLDGWSPLGPNMGSAFGLGDTGEPMGPLRELHQVQQEYFAAHQRYCRTFEECAWSPPEPSRYFYYLSRDEVAGGSDVPDPSLLRLRAEGFFAVAELAPEVAAEGYVIMAIADLDDDPELDVWVVDHTGRLAQLHEDRP